MIGRMLKRAADRAACLIGMTTIRLLFAIFDVIVQQYQLFISLQFSNETVRSRIAYNHEIRPLNIRPRNVPRILYQQWTMYRLETLYERKHGVHFTPRNKMVGRGDIV